MYRQATTELPLIRALPATPFVFARGRAYESSGDTFV
jgi:hypothetical protein